MKLSKKAELNVVPTSDATISATPAAITGNDGQDLLSYPSPFQEGETVIACYSTGHYYLSKVEKIMFEKDWRYFIHYMGWNKSWDEWLGINDVLKQTEDNMKKVSHDKKKTTDKYAKSGRVSQIKLDLSDSSGKKHKNNSTLAGRKRKRDQIENKIWYSSAQNNNNNNITPMSQSVSKGCRLLRGKGKSDARNRTSHGEEKENSPVEKLVNIPIPPLLKKQLVDEFEFINQRDKLVSLPRTPNVDAIIEKYCTFREKEGLPSESVVEVMNGLCVYFNEALPVLLLYNKERQQFQEAVVENSTHPSPSAVYGAEHLLRLFVKLPALLYELKVEEETLKVLQQTLLHFLKFLQKNQGLFFQTTYQVPVNRQRCTDKDLV